MPLRGDRGFLPDLKVREQTDDRNSDEDEDARDGVGWQ